MKILLTTPDYPPKLGGLSTYSVLLENCLVELGHEVEVFNWSKISDIKSFKVPVVDYIINVHFMGGYFLAGRGKTKIINIVHGSEILFKSPNPIKNFIKKLMRSRMLDYFHNSNKNIFISQFTENKLVELGLKKNYARDIVFHNCIDSEYNQRIDRIWGAPYHFCSIARDVPHKNLNKVHRICANFCNSNKVQGHLYMTSSRFSDNGFLKYHDISNISNTERHNIYMKSHFNFLLSEDHSESGFFEGFGLTPLEAGLFSTPTISSCHGGLDENIFSNITGFKSNTEKDIVKYLNKMRSKKYVELQALTYEHTMNSHTQKQFMEFLNYVI